MLVGFASCSDDPDGPEVEPNFPTPSEQTVADDGTVSLPEFTPNLDWKIENSNPTYFSMKINGTESVTLTGAAGQAVNVAVTPVATPQSKEEIAEIALTMGGQTQTILTVHLEPTDPFVAVYLAKRTADGNFDSKDAKYVYDLEKEAEAMDFSADNHFEERFEVSTNVDLTLVYPYNWLTLDVNVYGEQPEEKPDLTKVASGLTEYHATVADSDRPFEDAKETISFLDVSDEELYSVEVTVEGCAMEYEINNLKLVDEGMPEEFNAAGKYLYSNGQAGEDKTFSVTAAYGSQVVIVYLPDLTTDEGWLHLDAGFNEGTEDTGDGAKDFWTDVRKSAGLHSRFMTLSCDPNEEDSARNAYVFVIPRGAIDDVDKFKPSDVVVEGNLAPEYADYMAAAVKQRAFSNTSDEFNAAFAYADPYEDWSSYSKWADLTDVAQDPILGELDDIKAYALYFKDWTAVDITNITYAGADDFEIKDGSSGESATWIDLKEDNGSGKYYVKLDGAWDDVSDSFKWNGTAPEGNTAYILFKSGEDYVGAIKVVFGEEAFEGGSADGNALFAVASGNPNVILETLTGGFGYEASYDCPQYKLTVSNTNMVSFTKCLFAEEDYDDLKIVDLDTEEEEPEWLAYLAGMIMLYEDDETGEADNAAQLVFSKNGKPIAVLVVMFSFDSDSDAPGQGGGNEPSEVKIELAENNPSNATLRLTTKEDAWFDEDLQVPQYTLIADGSDNVYFSVLPGTAKGNNELGYRVSPVFEDEDDPDYDLYERAEEYWFDVDSADGGYISVYLIGEDSEVDNGDTVKYKVDFYNDYTRVCQLYVQATLRY